MSKPPVEYAHELPATPMDPVVLARRNEKIKISTISLCGCWGCTLSLLDMDEALLGLLDKCTILRSSLTDIKRISERCAVGFIEGGVANEENIETLQHFREHCDILISVGACAIWGGIPAMRNDQTLEDCLREAYIDAATVVPGAKPTIPYHQHIPRLTDKVIPCHEVVKMDYFLPGCPPDSAAIHKVLDDIINGRTVELPRLFNRYD